MPELLPPPEERRSWPLRIGWFILGYLVLVVTCLPALLLIQPETALGWVLLIVLGPPVYLSLEWTGGKIAAPWGERTRIQKLAKAGCIVFGYLALLVLWLLFGPAA